MKMLIVKWHDAVTDHGWTDLAEAAQLSLDCVTSVGYVVAEMPDRIILAASWDGESSVNQQIVIPRDWIEEIVVLPES